MSVASTLVAELGAAMRGDCVPAEEALRYVDDATVVRGLHGRADAVAFPDSAEDVAACMAWCYRHGVTITPRGGGTGYAGGAVPIDGGVVVSLERLKAVRDLDPLLWRMQVEAGLRTADVRRLARENGLFFPPDPAAAEDSQIGGNIATNAGGPHAFKYGVTGNWVTGLEAVVPPGELIRVGGAIRKDQSGYDLKRLLIGSEGTLGIVTAAWLRLLPAPEAVLPVVAYFGSAEAGCGALQRILGSGLQAAAIDYLDRGALDLSRAAYPGRIPEGAGLMLIAEADGGVAEATEVREGLLEAMDEDALATQAPTGRGDVVELWRWRDGVSLAAAAKLGGKIGEDIVVPVDRLAEAIEAVAEIGSRHGVEAVSWGHAGDGNLHANFLVDPADSEQLRRADGAAADVFGLAIDLEGSVSGEHGIGWLKRGELERQWAPRALDLHAAIKRAFDPENLLNPGKKL